MSAQGEARSVQPPIWEVRDIIGDAARRAYELGASTIPWDRLTEDERAWWRRSIGALLDYIAIGPNGSLVACSGGRSYLDKLAMSTLTVGAALARPDVQDGSHVIEAPTRLRDSFVQIRVKGDAAEVRWSGTTWGPRHPIGDLSTRAFIEPCRLVPIAEADRDPADRGAL